MQAKVAGRFLFSKRKRDEKESERGEFYNLIVDEGLEGLGTLTPSSLLAEVYVGSGSTAPTVADNSMEALVATTSSQLSTEQGTEQDESSNWYTYYRVTKRFIEGQAAGNLSEVGIGWSSGLFSRALIRDSGGSPTTITVLSDEVLDVTYELRIYPPTTDVTGTTDIGGVTYDYTARASNIDAADSTSGWRIDSTRSNTIRFLSYVYAGAIGDVFSSPSGTSYSTSAGFSSAPYTPGSYEAGASVTYGLGEGNIGGVRSTVIMMGWTRWQVEFSSQVDGSPIPKDNTKELTLNFSHSWARA